jgi:hypothetical protein
MNASTRPLPANLAGTAHAWASAFFALVDTLDSDAIATRFDPGIVLRFGNREPLVGRDAVRASFIETGRNLRSVSHRILGVWTGRDAGREVISVEADVTYRLGDGRVVSVPATSTLRLGEGGRIVDYRIFIDTTPVFGPAT